jgi:hypothetical protein
MLPDIARSIFKAGISGWHIAQRPDSLKECEGIQSAADVSSKDQCINDASPCQFGDCHFTEIWVYGLTLAITWPQ